MNRDFKGVFIPEDVCKNQEISWLEKCYLSLYEQYSSLIEADYWMSKIVCLSTLQKIKKSLIDKSLIPQPIKFSSAQEAKEFTINSFNTGDKCDWCGTKCLILHKHHYPIPKSRGGSDVVYICPNCHCVFHSVYTSGGLE